jgi:hypothetical protein
MKFTCPICDSDIESEESLPFGEKIKCSSCENEFIVDYDYSGEDYNLSFWLTSLQNYEISDIS